MSPPQDNAAAVRFDLPPDGGTWHDQYKEIGSGPLPVEPYISQQHFELERDHVFRKVWLNLARIEELPNVGDYIVKDLPIGQTSVLILRDEKGEIRAFHNSCSHRGTKVVWNGAGNARQFSCKAHGWTYGLNGGLKIIPDEESYFCVNKGENGLTPIVTDIWEGFIFINLDREPRQTLREYLGDWADGMEGYPFAELSKVRFLWRCEVNANWKLVKDGFQEPFHAAFLHKRTLPDHFGGKENPFGHAADYRLWDHAGSYAAYANKAHRIKPVEALAIKYAAPAGKGFSGAGGDSADAFADFPRGINRARHPDWTLDVNFIFPNLFIDVSAGGYFGYRMWPVAVDKTIWEIFYHFPEPKNAGEKFSQQYNMLTLRDALYEDARMGEETQAVLSSGAKTHMHLQDHELLIRHDRKTLDDYIFGRHDAAQQPA